MMYKDLALKSMLIPGSITYELCELKQVTELP